MGLGRNTVGKRAIPTLLLAVAMTGVGGPSDAADGLYDGPLRLTASHLEVRIRPGAAEVSARYRVFNAGKLAVAASIRLVRGGPAPKPANPQAVSIGPGERKDVAFSYSLPSGVGAFHSVRMDPSVLVDGRPYARRVPESQLVLRLPVSSRFVAATRPPDDWANHPAGASLRWIGRDRMLQPNTVHWTDQAIDLRLTTRVSPLARRGQLAVDVRVSNMSARPIEGLVLRTDFPEGIALPLPGEASVSSVPDEDPTTDNDVHYRWEARVETLKPGEEKAFVFRVAVGSGRGELPPTSAWLNGSIVALSSGAGWSVPPPPPGPATTLSQPTGWQVSYVDHDNWLRRLLVLSQPAVADPGQERISGQDEADLGDVSGDDAYRWVIENDIWSIPDAVVITGESPDMASRAVEQGQPNENLIFQQVHDASYSDPRLMGLEGATVLLRGWSLQFTSGDHPIQKAGVTIENVVFDAAAGTLSWRAAAWLSDEQPDDPYHWRYWWQIVGLRNGRVFVYPLRSGTAAQGTHVDQPSLPLPTLTPYDNRVVVPLGWTMAFADGEHNLRSMGLSVTNPRFGTDDFGWTATVNFADDSGDDPIRWEYAVAVLAWNGGGRGHLTAGPETVGGGGWSGRPYSVRVAEVVSPQEREWANHVKDGSEAGVDCGGASPSVCVQCLAPSMDPGDAEDAGFFSLDSVEVLLTAQMALEEYALARGEDQTALYSGPATVDRYVDAVAAYVANHMVWAPDAKIGDWHGGQSALTTIKDSGSRGCGRDYCGDCEDHSFLRAALLRSLKVSWQCVFSARHPGDLDLGDLCSGPTKGHVFNIVYYEGRYRILDYTGDLHGKSWADCSQMHALNNVFNDHYGNLNGPNLTPVDGRFLMNYPGHANCPVATWDWRTYFFDICP